MKVQFSPSQPNAALPAAGSATDTGRTAGASFGQALARAGQHAPAHTVARGDTLVTLVREQAAQRGLRLTPGQALAQAHQLARDNAIANPDRIFPGQNLALQGLHTRLAALPGAGVPLAGAHAAPAVPAAQVLAQASAVGWAGTASNRRVAAYAQEARASEPASGAGNEPAAGAHPVLQQTLDRAVAQGFIPAIERGDVHDKILELAQRHGFKPDDFARMTLLESDGMNPRASNSRCHGIIQFCDGNDRGAATAGYAANPRAILGFSVYQQLHLVDKYFSEVGVKPAGAATVGLDDLYLSVLMPAARGNTDASAPLNIPGPQARVLHVGRDRSAPITRQSILEGLRQHAADRLAEHAKRARPQAALAGDLLPGTVATRLR
jgi:hypothetical protein